MIGSNGGETLLHVGADLRLQNAEARLRDAKDEGEFLLKALRELYLASIPLTGGRSPSGAEWERWFEAMHNAHDWTTDGDWPEWAGPEPL